MALEQSHEQRIQRVDARVSDIEKDVGEMKGKLTFIIAVQMVLLAGIVTALAKMFL